MSSAALMLEAQEPIAPPVEKRASNAGRKHLTTKQIALVIQLTDQGKTQVEISQLLGVADSTISRTLAEFGDTREIARKRLEAGALKLARTVANTKDAAVALKTLGKLDVVREDQAGAGTSVLIAIGQPGSALAPPDIMIKANP